MSRTNPTLRGFPSRPAVALWLSGMVHLCILGSAGLIFLTDLAPQPEWDEIQVAMVKETKVERAEPLAQVSSPGSGRASVVVAASAEIREVDPLPVREWMPRAMSTGGAVSQLGGLFGSHSGNSLLKRQGGQGDGANFFGISAAGKRFVFVVDSSRSMIGERWARACEELLDTLERMGSDREFYVFFFDVDAHPMFGASDEGALPGTEDNIGRLIRWMHTIEHGPETRPLNALRKAVEMKPDAIYLLSDGEFRDRSAMFLRRNNDLEQDGIVVHTIGLASRKGQKVLRRIANENGGQYRFVPVR